MAPRKVISPTDLWLDPSAEHNVSIDIATRHEPHELHPAQRAVHFALRYEGEIKNGGHVQYFENLARGPLGTDLVPDAIAGLEELGAPLHADILRRAYARWLSAARLPFADLEDFSAICAEGEFRDLDDEFFSLDRPLGPEWLWVLISRNIWDNRPLYVELGAAATDNDQLLAAMGNPFEHTDGGRAAWISLLENVDPRVRARAALALSHHDPQIALPVLEKLEADRAELPTSLDWPLRETLARLRSDRDNAL